ncbi:tudor-interacting repair regulator protein-like [Frankliniella occidentalis]|uniref:Tudor-interacting repair regulator protein-like n=1 Tax=Frankliniella occidentalis TaxID=133901 RepID=A0A9C6X407_FRAOC|nr:tudor-interacting repair regulator protein-like [Frankliniella occidentalis]
MVDGPLRSQRPVNEPNFVVVRKICGLLAQVQLSEENHVVTHWSPSEKILLHFYAIEVSQETLREIEREALKSHDYGTEVMGTFRVPLYTMSDGQRGFPTFLRNSFVGNAYHQLRRGLLQSSIMSEEEIRTAEAISQKIYGYFKWQYQLFHAVVDYILSLSHGTVYVNISLLRL